MSEEKRSEEDHLRETRARLVEAALPHVPFDGWSDAVLALAIADSGVDEGLARLACPRGAVDLALAAHREGDAEMVARLDATNLTSLRMRERIAMAVRVRIEAAGDRETVRRGVTFFAMPAHAADGAAAIWQTADVIWTTLGDPSDDVNWYTKRAILSGVYSSTLLYWLGDESDGHRATWEFLARRIDNVMGFEKLKAQVLANPLAKRFAAGPGRVFGRIRKPASGGRPDLPGHVAGRTETETQA